MIVFNVVLMYFVSFLILKPKEYYRQLDSIQSNNKKSKQFPLYCKTNEALIIPIPAIPIMVKIAEKRYHP